MIRQNTTAACPSASILMVDDFPTNLHMLGAMLGNRGYDLRPVTSGRLALTEARHNPPDLILLDVNMPEMSGYEVCEQLKADDKLKSIPVIYISALTEELDKVKAFALGGVDYITKPFHMQELNARVATHLNLHRLQVALEEHNHQLELAQERLKVDLELARHVQRRLLPLRVPLVPDYEFFAHYEPAYEVGGDYYDFIALPGRRVAVMLGDVAGKGVAAALLMAKLSADIRFCMLMEPDPAAAITRLNNLMSQAEIGGQVVTLVAAVLDPDNHSVTLVNAGHPSPLFYSRATGNVAEAIRNEAVGLPLGVSEGFEYGACRLPLEPGDSILAFTDGVIEAADSAGRLLHTEGLYAALAGRSFSTQQLGAEVVQTVHQFAAGHNQDDDIAVVGFGRLE